MSSTKTLKTLKINLAGLALVAGLALPAAGPVFAAEQPSAEQIIKALKPAKLTRGLSASPADTARSAEEARFVDSLRNRTTRSLTTTEREQITSIADKKPSIDLEVNFEYNSATIGSKAQPQVTVLGQALSSSDLKGRTFVVAGHTDGTGGESYNQELSERRAEAVKRFLAEKYGIEASNLVTVGYGKTRLKNSSDPTAADNRRVQVINMSDK
jgi:outer membrane protein OmpA-like peptidoglycan-associated protein